MKGEDLCRIREMEGLKVEFFSAEQRERIFQVVERLSSNEVLQQKIKVSFNVLGEAFKLYR